MVEKNNISGAINKSEFATLSGLKPVSAFVDGVLSKRDWYVVANLSKGGPAIVQQTALFASACARARTGAGGGSEYEKEEPPYKLGLDEKGRLKILHHPEQTREVYDLQGYVWAALQECIGGGLIKFTRGGFAVDGVILSANLLIEIKTSTEADDLYKGLGQLKLYPFLIGWQEKLDPVLLLPDTKPLKPTMAAALQREGIGIFTYSVGSEGQLPEIAFSKEFLERCKRRVNQKASASRE